jgi:hypothetical protein
MAQNGYMTPQSNKVPNQLGSILETREPPRIVQQTFKAIVVDIILQFRKQAADEVTDEDHLSLEGTQN